MRLKQWSRKHKDTNERAETPPAQAKAKRRRVRGKQSSAEARSANTVDEADTKFDELLPVIRLSAEVVVVYAHGPTREMYDNECAFEERMAELRAKEVIAAQVERRQAAKDRIVPAWSRTVSYTHLTLPTIYSV